MKSNALLLHHPDAVDTNGAKVMGRHSAGEGFLKGYARYAEADRFYCYAPKAAHFRDFQERIVAFRGRNDKPTEWIAPSKLGRTEHPGCLQVPGPGIDDAAWLRRYHDARSYSVCGVTHTIASSGAMGALGQLLTAPVQPWDALICTSRAVKSSVELVLDTYADYLSQRIGGKPRNIVRLPIIPLGVDCSGFAPSKTSGAVREEWRRKLHIGDKDIAILFLGRLSFHAKAHPVPMYIALQAAAKRSRNKIHLIQAGQFSNASIEREFRETAKTFCPDINAIFVDSRPAENRNGVWRAADVFTSLSDNIQESFGLTPIEAKAAGLPLVVSDWDGYRDTVRHGVDGFTIPTRMPEAPLGEDFAYGHESEADTYDRYIGHVSQCTIVDVQAAADAYVALCGDADLRRRMGEAAQRHAREHLDWSVVIAAYQDLWDELAAQRRAAKEIAARRPNTPASPLSGDPFAVFAKYPTAPLTERDSVAVCSDKPIEQLDQLLRFGMNTFAQEYLVPRELIEVVLRALSAYGPSPVGDLARMVPPPRYAAMIRTIAWLGKMGIVSPVADAKAKATKETTPVRAAV